MLTVVCCVLFCVLVDEHHTQKLDFFPDAVTKHVSFLTVVEKMEDKVIEYFVKKKLKPIRKALETKFYASVRNRN